MFKLDNIKFEYVEKNTKIGEIINEVVKELNDDKLEVKEFDINVMPFAIRFLAKAVFNVEYSGHSKLMIFINKDYELKLGMNSEGILELSLLKHLTKFLSEIDRRIKNHLDEIKEIDKKEDENIIQKDDNDGKEDLARLIGEVFLEILSEGANKDGE